MIGSPPDTTVIAGFEEAFLFDESSPVSEVALTGTGSAAGVAAIMEPAINTASKIP